MAIGMPMLSGVVPFFFSTFLIRKRMMNAKDTKGKERRRNHYSPPAFSMTKIAIIKRDKDSLRICTWTTAQRLC